MAQTFTRVEIIASAISNGLREIGKNKWADATHEYSMRSAGAGRFTLNCTRTAPWPGMNVAMREALRPAFLASRS